MPLWNPVFLLQIHYYCKKNLDIMISTCAIAYSFKPLWNAASLVAPEVKVDDDDREKGGEGDQDHVQTVICT